jgi:hypothetical protein
MCNNQGQSDVLTSGAHHWSSVTLTLYYMFLLTSPLNVYGLGSGLFNYRFSRIFLILTVFAIVIERLSKIRNLFLRLYFFEYLLGIYCFLAFSTVLYVSNYNAYATRFFGLIECILILYVIRMVTHEEGYWLRTVQVYLLSSILVLLASSYQVVNALRGNLYGTILPFPSLQLLERYEELGNWEYFGAITEGGIRVSATFSEPNMLAGYCASLIPFAIVMVLISNKNRIIKWRSFINLIILLGLVVMIIATVSKTGFLSMVLGILLILIFTFMKFNAKQRRWIAIVLVLIVGCGVSYGSQFAVLIAERLSLGDSGHMKYSLIAWNEYIEGSWLWGEGFGQYVYVSAHTIILTALLELGLPGGLLILMITLQPLGNMRYLSRLSHLIYNDPGMKNYFLIMSSSLASFCAILLGLHLYDYWMHPFTWISISLLISMGSHVKYGFRNGIFRTL